MRVEAVSMCVDLSFICEGSRTSRAACCETLMKIEGVNLPEDSPS